MLHLKDFFFLGLHTSLCMCVCVCMCLYVISKLPYFHLQSQYLQNEIPQTYKSYFEPSKPPLCCQAPDVWVPLSVFLSIIHLWYLKGP